MSTIKVAAYPSGIKANGNCWRYQLDNGPIILVRGICFDCPITPDNLLLASNPKIPEYEMSAWLECQGKVSTERGIAKISFSQTSGKPHAPPAKTLPSACWDRDIRLAVSKKRLRSGDHRHWRIFIGSDTIEIPISGLDITGLPTPNNCLAQVNPAGDKTPEKMIAWLLLHGSIRLNQDNTASVKLS